MAQIKFIRKIALFFLLLIVLDFSIGQAFNYMSVHSKGGYVAHHNHIIDKTHEDILIFGSSRAIHHYNPEIISKDLNMTCYNAGQDGNGIILFYGWWKLISQRYSPKIIIYDVTTEFDLQKNDNHKYIGWLKELYDREPIPEIFEAVDNTERVKMLSRTYRYNSKFQQIAADYFHPIYKVKGNGFLPLEGVLDTMRITKKKSENMIQFDSLKINYLAKYIEDVGKSQIIFVHSPIWYGLDTAKLQPIKELCAKNNVPFFDYSNDSEFVHNNNLFKDGAHLNAKGADIFTAKFVDDLKRKSFLRGASQK